MQVQVTFTINGVRSLRELNQWECKELTDFIEDALTTWGGQRHPEDWLFNSLQVSRIKLLRP